MDDLAALRLQIEWGADEALEDAPVDRLRAAPPPPNPLPQGEGENLASKPPPPLAGGGWGEGAATHPATSRPTAADRAFQSAAAATTVCAKP